MYPFGGILVAPLVAAYLASVLSRYWRRREKRPGWVAGVLAILGGIFAAWVCSFQLDLFMPWRWSNADGKAHLLFSILITGFLAGFVGIIPAAWMVERHQKIHDKTHPDV